MLDSTFKPCCQVIFLYSNFPFLDLILIHVISANEVFDHGLLADRNLLFQGDVEPGFGIGE